MSDDETTVFEIPYGTRGDVWRASVRSWLPPDSRTGKPIPLVSIRKWTQGRDGTTMLPSKSGLSCAAGALAAIRDCLRALCDQHGVPWDGRVQPPSVPQGAPRRPETGAARPTHPAAPHGDELPF